VKKLPVPGYDDAAAFRALSENDRLNCYPDLIPVVATICAAYVDYEANLGSPLVVVNPVTSPLVEGHLEYYYKSPPKNLRHITEMRKRSSPHSCSMCGSLHSGQLDHVLPQATYAGFSVFSKNLVPACKCNSMRQDATTGVGPGERILHPYFDQVLEQRLLRANFEDLGKIPKVSIKILVPTTDPIYPAVKFHVEAVIAKTSINGFLALKWEKFIELPKRVTTRLESEVKSLADLKNILEDQRDIEDGSYDSKNNWESVFISGLLDPPVLNWIAGKLLTAGRLPNSPLVC